MINTLLYFGSFNPIHIGHTAIANYALAEGLTEEVWFVVSPQNPLKAADGLAPEHHRLEMINIAVNGCGISSSASASDIEFSMPVPSFTIHTLEKLAEMHPEREFCIIMGEDNLVDIKKWKEYGRIIESYPILVYPRTGCEAADELKSLPNITILNDAPLFEISSTKLRSYLKAGKHIPALLPPGVYDYIRKNKLYITQ